MRAAVIFFLACVCSHVYAVATIQDMLDQVELYTESQNTANSTLIGTLFTPNGIINMPRGTTTVNGVDNIVAFYNEFFQGTGKIIEAVDGPIITNGNIVTYRKTFEAAAYNFAPIPVVTWYVFDTATVPPLIIELNAVWGNVTNPW
eukprot:TRINITY_DN94_c0_g1_i2.p1 TRINITY_DN94_c0_g1~~TRINITY_DN94_c0_g1_i2.p1  ORF type:complete len:146 (-),score=38.62 TRINITY_DN94_c0_g1_i2:48-485(-)